MSNWNLEPPKSRDLELVAAMRELRKSNPGKTFQIRDHGWFGKSVWVRQIFEWNFYCTTSEVKKQFEMERKRS